jgi:dUTP pyrophosphatase
MQVSLVHPRAKAPLRATAGAAGYDLFACEDAMILPGDRELVNTGIIVAVPGMAYARVAPRSGMALRGIDVGAGVIDGDYRGAVQVLLINNSPQPYEVKAGDRVAQLIIECIITPRMYVADCIEETARGAGGFGSSGWR